MKNLFAIALIACVWLASFAVRADGVPNGSLRLATYNTYLLSPLFKCSPLKGLMPDCLAQIGGETEQWATRLANEILGHYDEIDVIALNEVWDEDAKDILARKLKTAYPIQIRDIDAPLVSIRAELFTEGLNAAAGYEVKGEDSGLMLFAKNNFKVEPLPNGSYRWPKDAASTLDASSPEVAFVLYDACSDDDCLAAKGAALVRLKHKGNGQIHNIVFTHMQADYPDDDAFYVNTRLKQFKAIKAMIGTTLPGVESRLADGRETLFLAGDLNVPLLHDHAEWDKRFRVGYFHKPLYDSMVFTSAPEDKTPTNEYDDDRLDYILASPSPFVYPGKHTCVQHVTIPTDFRSLESDHWLVHVDIQTGFHHCSPATAFKLSLPASGIGQTIDQSSENSALDVTKIHAPGAMQWFFIDADQAGSFSIGTSKSDIDLEIYLPEDMTTPVSRYNKTPAQVPFCAALCFAYDTYVLPDKFYIRTRGDKRTTTGDYSLSIRRHQCASKQDACILVPGGSSSATLSPEEIPQGTPQDRAWFRFDVVGKATSGKLQTIALTADGVDGPRVSSELVDLDLSSNSGAPATDQSGSTYVAKIKAGHGSKGYLRVKQASRLPGDVGTKITASYDSNLRFLTVGNLICRDETNPETGSDDMFTRFFFDDDNRRAPTQGYVEFDCDNHSDTKDWASRLGTDELRYLKALSVRLVEEDDTSDNDNSNRFSIEDLGANQLHGNGRLEWAFDEGKYRFEYELRRRPNKPVAD